MKSLIILFGILVHLPFLWACEGLKVELGDDYKVVEGDIGFNFTVNLNKACDKDIEFFFDVTQSDEMTSRDYFAFFLERRNSFIIPAGQT